MYSLIILASTLCFAHASFYAGPPAHIQLTHDGQYVQDTPEVAHAKAAHFAAHAQASSGHGAWAPGPVAYAGAGHYGGEHYGAGHYGAPAAGLHKYGPAPLAHDGRVVDTADVAHAKAAHAAAHAAAHHGAHGYAGYGGHAGFAGHAFAGPVAHGAAYAPSYGKWHGPPAHIELTHDGQYVKDTPEVAHARAAHLAQYAHVAHSAALQPEEAWGHGHGWH